MSITPAAENVTVKHDGTVLRNSTPIGTVELTFTDSNPWTFIDANGYGTEDTFPTCRDAVEALLRRADRANTQHTAADTAHATTSRLRRAWARTVQRITL